MTRKLTIKVNSAQGLSKGDCEDIADPFVVVCFDSNVSKQLGRTEVVQDNECPTWDHEFEVDVAEQIKELVESGRGEPKMITFCVYDGDVDSCQPLGVAGVSFKELLKKGHVEGDFPVFHGNGGTVNVSVSMKKVKKNSMFTDNGWIKVAGGVAVGTAAVGLLGAYLYNKNKEKKEKQGQLAAVQEEGGNPPEGVDPAEVEYAPQCQAQTSGLPFGLHEHDDSDDDETFKPWWQMEDEDDDEEEPWKLDD